MKTYEDIGERLIAMAINKNWNRQPNPVFVRLSTKHYKEFTHGYGSKINYKHGLPVVYLYPSGELRLWTKIIVDI